MKTIAERGSWFQTRDELLAQEKEHTRERDRLQRSRLQLPMRAFPTNHAFQGPGGPASFLELFEGRSSLIVYHFVFPPGAGPEHPAWRTCIDGCAFVADHIDAARLHLIHHGVNLVCVSEAPFEELAAFKSRMNWSFPWYGRATAQFHGEVFSPSGNPVSPSPGISVYLQRDDQIFLTYTTTRRGSDILIGTYNYLDLAPHGRNEKTPMDWVRFHDEY